jgi:hypothetical protein
MRSTHLDGNSVSTQHLHWEMVGCSIVVSTSACVLPLLQCIALTHAALLSRWCSRHDQALQIERDALALQVHRWVLPASPLKPAPL